MEKTAIIIGAGPAGLTAAYELLKNTDIKPIIFEESNDIGGISRTVNHKGNRIDIGGHRFFSKSDVVMNWWKEIFPIQTSPSIDDIRLNNSLCISRINSDKINPETTDQVMLVRHRLSRIFFLRRFFNYPISLSINTLVNLGFYRTLKIVFSYVKAVVFPKRKEDSLEDFFINRFGRELYKTFFKDYTEKIWGIPCSEMSPIWGAQRVKGLSIAGVVLHALKSIFNKTKSVDQKKIETSLIDTFLYPKFGPGQLWETVADKIISMGGEIHKNAKVVKINEEKNRVISIEIINDKAENANEIMGDYFISTMPIKELICGMNNVSKDILEIAKGLQYRDFITVGLLIKELKIKNDSNEITSNNLIPDTWIYVQERDVKLGRIQVFNNWSPYLVKNKDNVWLGLEYFSNEGDFLWTMNDNAFVNFAIEELVRLNIINKENVLDSIVIRVKNAYPVYFGSYSRFDRIVEYLNGISNLFPIGRNGMHRYNNMDHSMMTAMLAVENIKKGLESKSNIWNVNTEQEYHEERG